MFIFEIEEPLDLLFDESRLIRIDEARYQFDLTAIDKPRVDNECMGRARLDSGFARGLRPSSNQRTSSTRWGIHF